MTAAQHLSLPDFRVRQFGGEQIVLVLNRLRDTDMAEPAQLVVRHHAAETAAADLCAAIVVVHGEVHVVRRRTRLSAEMVLQAVGAAVQRPELEMPALSRRRGDGIASDTVERARPLEDPRLRHQNGVGVRRARRARDISVAEIRQLVASSWMRPDRVR
ncbi:hypothetical protein [Nocardia asiatica]|uniref:hypothetical protein n=1 Tax=Nocardia asiatica TaxID=209252 RepID=UPI002458F0E1|nr:hypothetical protein [Nocardia asiatica]